MNRKQKDVMQVIRMILLLIVIVVLIWTVATLIRSGDIIRQDPLKYGMESYNFTSCSCIDSSGLLWQSTETGFIHEEIQIPFYEFEVFNGTG